MKYVRNVTEGEKRGITWGLSQQLGGLRLRRRYVSYLYIS
jgi:hypothetical protein